MKKNDLQTMVLQQARQAMNSTGSEVSDHRQEFLDLYRGEKLPGDDSPEMVGRSTYKTREVLEGVEWFLVSALRFFFAHASPVSFDPVGPEDEELADQETQVCNHVVLDRSYLSLSMIFKEAALSPVSYGRVRVKAQAHREVETLEGQTEMDLAPVYADPTVERVEVLKTYVKTVDPLDTLPSAQHDRLAMEMAQRPVMPVAEVECYDVRVHTYIDRSDVCIEPVPPEEMLIDPNLTSLDLDEADFVAQKSRISVSDLVEMGFDRDEVMEHAGDFEYDENGEDVNRRPLADEDPDQFRSDSNSPQPYAEVLEAYIRTDYDDDGYAELRRVFLIGGEVFENEVVPEHPFAAFSCIPMPHRHIGVSYAELLAEIQKLSTVLMRQLLDSLYAVNRDRKYYNVHAFSETGGLESLQNRQSMLVGVDGDPRASVMPEEQMSLASEILPVMARVDAKQATRTGIAPDRTLDPEVLKRTTATAHAGAMEEQSGRVEAVVRTLAETGYKSLVRKVHSALRRHGASSLARRIRGRYIPRNPLTWGVRHDLTVNVGLGYASRQQKLDAYMQVLALQEKAQAFGLVDPRGAFTALARVVEEAGIGFPTEYFVDPNPAEGWQPPQPPPDPNLILAEASMLEAKSKVESEKQKLQIDLERERTKAEAEKHKLAQELQLQQQRNETELAKMQVEYEMRLRELHLKAAEARIKLADMLTKAEVADANAAKLRSEAEASLKQASEGSNGSAED